MEIIDRVNHMNSLGLPFPLCQCQCCGGTMFKDNHWVQCPDCGSLSTSYGGCYEELASTEWKNKCSEAMSVWKNLD